MVLALSYLIVVCLFFFVNSLFYSLAVVGVSSMIMFYMVSSSKVSLLVFIFFIIVYVGAMMIFIGYICAVCPNFVVHSKFSFKFFVLLVFSGSFIVNMNFMKIEFLSKQMVLVDYFYSSWGMNLFIFLVVFMFIVLVMVTSQYIFPKGPFRSLN